MRIAIVGNAKSIHTQKWAGGLANRGHDVTVFTMATAEPFHPNVSLSQHTNRFLAGRIIATAHALRSAHNRQPFDVVNAHYVSSHGIVSALSGVAPTVLSAWGSDLLIVPNRSRFHRTLMRWVLAKGTAVTTVSTQLTDAALGLGVAQDCVMDGPNGVNLTMFSAPARDEDRDLTFVCTRGHAPIYRVADVLLGLAAGLRAHPKWTLGIVGDGPLTPSLRRLASELGIAAQVTWFGPLSPAEVANVLKRSVIYISASESDGTSMSLAEAMATGCFPVVSDIVANRQWLSDGESALFFAVGDTTSLGACAASAVEDPDRRMTAFAINRRVIEERLDWEKCLDQFEKVYLWAQARGARRA